VTTEAPSRDAPSRDVPSRDRAEPSDAVTTTTVQVPTTRPGDGTRTGSTRERRTNPREHSNGGSGLRKRATGAAASPSADAAASTPDDGDQAAFGLLFRRHASAVHTFAQRRTRSADIADDVTAVAFEKAWRSLDQLGPRFGNRFRPWVFRIAANEMASLMRSRSRRQQREHLAVSRGEIPADGVVGADGDGLALIDDAIDNEVILQALGELSERHQEVISLRYLSDLTSAETAAAMGLSRSNVAVLLHRALRVLREQIEEAS